MIIFPTPFIQLDPYPGYYWNTDEKALYSIKVSGMLHPLSKHKGFTGHTRFGYIDIKPGWAISRNGVKRHLTESLIEVIIKKMDLTKTQVVPME